MQVRSLRLLTFALPSLAAVAPPPAVHDASTVHEGYATVGTDAGHTAFAGTAGWALHNDRRIEDYGHPAVHRTAEVTKALVAAYYGRPPEKSYFIGCSLWPSCT